MEKFKKATAFFLVPFLFFLSALFLSAENKSSGIKGYVDVHCHLWGVEGAGFESTGQKGTKTDYEAAAMNLITNFMDKYGVEKALLMPPPRTIGNIDKTEFSELIKLLKNHSDRFCVAGGGDTLNSLIHSTKSSSVTEQVKANFQSEADKLLKSGISAFGEMASLHFSFTDKHVFESVEADHPLFLLLADIAAKNNMPIDLHMEAVSSDISFPKGFGKNNPSELKENISAFEELLSHNRNAKIVWQHIGWDNTGHMTLELLNRLLSSHSNLYIALRVEDRTLTKDKKPMPNRIVDDKWIVKNEWKEFIEKFSDRIVIGTDQFVGIPGKSGYAHQSFGETWKILSQLNESTAKKIGRDNAIKIYNLK